MENLVATSAMVGRIWPHGGDRVKVSENLGATAVAPIAPVDTSLYVFKPVSKVTLKPKVEKEFYDLHPFLSCGACNFAN